MRFLRNDMFRFLWTLVVVIYSYLEAVCRSFLSVKRKDISQKTVLITGAGGGLGKQLAISFAKCGARVVLVDIDKASNDRSAALVKAMKFEAHAYACDCTNENEVQMVASQIQEEIGPIDILVNNAGLLNGKSIVMLTENEIRKNFEVNLLSQFWTIKAFLPGMMEQNEGHIVTIASSAGLHGTEYLTDYSASKFALIGLHESLGLELRAQGFHDIQVTTICPNFINTGMQWYPKTNLPWLIPMLQASECADEIVNAVRENQTLVVLPKVLGRVMAPKSFVPERGQLAIYDYLGLGIEPHLQRKKIRQNSKVKK